MQPWSDKRVRQIWRVCDNVCPDVVANGASCLSAAWALNCCILAMRRDAITKTACYNKRLPADIIRTWSRITEPQNRSDQNLNWRIYIGCLCLSIYIGCLCLSICVWMSLMCDLASTSVLWLQAHRHCALPQNLKWNSDSEITTSTAIYSRHFRIESDWVESSVLPVQSASSKKAELKGNGVSRINCRCPCCD